MTPSPFPRPALLAALLLLPFLPGSPGAFADIILLKNGNQMQGEIVHQDRRYLTIQLPNGLLRIDRRQVQGIESESRLDYLLAEADKHLLREDHRGAIDLFRSALEESPDHARAREGLEKSHLELATSLREQRLLGEAEVAYRDLLELRPGHSEARREIRNIEERRVELERRIQEGRELLAREEIQKGHDRLHEVYQQYPDYRERLGPTIAAACARLGQDAARREDHEEAERWLLEAIAHDPEMISRVAPVYAAVKTHHLHRLAREGEFEDLGREAGVALDIAPENPFLLYYQALSLQGTGQRRDAALLYLKISERKKPHDLLGSLDVLKKAAELKLSGLDPAEAESLAVEEVLPGKWRKLTTDHFEVYHRNHRVGRAVATMAEKVYWKLFRELGCKAHWHERCQIYIHPTREGFQTSSSGHAWTGGSHRILRVQGALSEHRIETFQAQAGLVQSIIPHEVTHAMLAHRLRYRGPIPLWINEGLAIRSEPEAVKRHYRRIVDQSLQLGQHFPVTSFVERTEYPDEDVQTYYAQCYSLTNYLVEKRGLGRFLSFLEELVLSPESLDLLLRRHYRISGTLALGNLWRGARN